MAVVQTFEQFVKFLTDNKVPHNINVEAQLLELPSNAAPLPGNLIIKWEKALPLVQFIQFMIDDVPVERIAEVETAIVRLDNRLEFGGFGFDHDRRRLYCRFTAPVYPDDGINPMTMNQIGHAVVRNAKEFHEALSRVVAGEAGAGVVQIYEAIVARRAAGGPTVPLS